MKARYLGHPSDPEGSPRSVSHHGLTFPKNTWVGIPDAVAKKLQDKGNPSFEIAKGSAEPAAAAVAPADPLASKADTGSGLGKDEVIARLSALEITFDPSSSLDDLRATLEDAEFAAGED